MGHGVVFVLVLAIAVGFGSVAVVAKAQSRHRRPTLRHLFVFTVALNGAAILAVCANYFGENLAHLVSPGLRFAIDILYRGAANVLLLFVFGSVLFLVRSLTDDAPSGAYLRGLMVTWTALVALFATGALTGWHIGTMPAAILANVLVDQLGQWVVLIEILRAVLHTTKITDILRRRLTRWLLVVLGGFWLTIIALSAATLTGLIGDPTLNLSAAITFVLLNGAILGLAPPFAQRLYGPTKSAESPGTISEALVERFAISPREREVVDLICRGYSNQEIADQLFISVATVKDHNHHIFKKTGVKSRTQLVALITGL